ncbi:MAG: CoA transferase [Thermomicrobiales bacterium]|nr:CoA transferase [Thermomicrobiales bacterium]
MKRPLDGVRILALSQFGAGPYGMMLLADLGAEIIKIEDPSAGGDVSRYVDPGAENQDSLYFQSLNRNNRCITLDLRSEAGRAVFHDLIRVSDGLFSNLRGDLPARLGLLHSNLQRINPAIVCCSLSGFGMTGPRAAEPGYDYLIQAYSGMMSLTGEPDSPPARAGVSVIDFSGGIAAALGLVTGIMQARQTGVGCDVDISLLDTAVSMLNYLAAWTLNSDYRPERLPNSSHPTLYPSQVLKTADGYMAIMCAKEKFWEALVPELDDDAIASDPRFARFADRFEHRDALWAELDRIFVTRTTADWLDRLRGKVPCAPVNSVEEALRDEQVLARQMVIEVEHPEFGPIRQTGNPIKFAGVEESHSPAAPLGADTSIILADLLGYTDERIRRLKAAGAI